MRCAALIVALAACDSSQSGAAVAKSGALAPKALTEPAAARFAVTLLRTP